MSIVKGLHKLSEESVEESRMLFKFKQKTAMSVTHLFRAVEEEHPADNGHRVHDTVPAIQVIFVSRESINQKVLLLAQLHGLGTDFSGLLN